MNELEAWGLLTQNQFAKFLTKFSQLFGKPRIIKRLAISFWDPYKDKNTDIRIRITNGEPQKVKKVGEWEEKLEWNFSESLYDLPKDSVKIYAEFQTLRSHLTDPDSYNIIQHHSHIFDQPDFELKLAKQFGKNVKYVFEVELKNKSRDLKGIIKNLGLTDYLLATDTAFWDKWNKEVNLTGRDIGEKEVNELIKKYLLS